MSSGRSRSGGRWIGKTAMRYQRSSRKRAVARPSPAGRGAWRRRCARRRAAVRWPPTRSKLPSCRTRSSRTCAASGSSPISSRKSVPPSARSNQPLRCADGAGEAAALVAEELGVDQPGRDRAAVHAQERARRARASARGSRARRPPCPSRSRRGSAPARRTARPARRAPSPARRPASAPTIVSPTDPGGRAARAASWRSASARLAQRRQLAQRGGRSRAPPRTARAAPARPPRARASKRRGGCATQQQHARAARRCAASGPTSTSPSTLVGQHAGQALARAARASRARVAPRRSDTRPATLQLRRRELACAPSAAGGVAARCGRGDRLERRAREIDAAHQQPVERQAARQERRAALRATRSISMCRQASRQTSSSSGAKRSMHSRLYPTDLLSSSVKAHISVNITWHNPIHLARKSSALPWRGTRLAQAPARSEGTVEAGV